VSLTPYVIYALIFSVADIKPFTVAEMTLKGHSRSSTMSSFVMSPGLHVRDRKSRLHLLSDKTAEMTLKVDQGHWWWDHSIGHVTLTVSGL